MKDLISVTINTKDREALEEVGKMLIALSARGVTAAEIKSVTGVDVGSVATPHHETSAAALETVALDGASFDVSATLSQVEAVVAPLPVTEQPAVVAPLPVTEQPAVVALDGEGLPWDARIHVSTKTRRKADNTWKLKKNQDAAFVESVKAELRGAPLPVTEQPAVVAPLPVTEQPAVVAPLPVTEQPAVVAPGTPTTFPGLLSAFTFQQQQGRITPEQMDAICQEPNIGLASLPLAASRPDLVPAIYARMVEVCSTQV